MMIGTSLVYFTLSLFIQLLIMTPNSILSNTPNFLSNTPNSKNDKIKNKFLTIKIYSFIKSFVIQ